MSERRLKRLELAGALAALAAALLLNQRLGAAASALGAGGPRAADTVLARLPVLDARPVFLWGFAAFVVLAAAYALARERERLAFIAWSYAALIAVRSLCIVLTPLRAPAGSLWVAGDPLYEALGRYLTFENDLFFSSHTALPFLAALVFRERRAKLAFLGVSFALAAAVLLARLHYSIDVAAAYAFTIAVHEVNRRRLAPAWRLRVRPLLRGLSAGRAS